MKDFGTYRLTMLTQGLVLCLALGGLRPALADSNRDHVQKQVRAINDKFASKLIAVDPKKYPNLYQKGTALYEVGTDKLGKKITSLLDLHDDNKTLMGNLRDRTMDDLYRYCTDNEFKNRPRYLCTKEFLTYNTPKPITANIDAHLQGRLFVVRGQFMAKTTDGNGNPLYQPIFIGKRKQPLFVKTGPKSYEPIKDADTIKAIVQAYRSSTFKNKKEQAVVNRFLSYFKPKSTLMARRASPRRQSHNRAIRNYANRNLGPRSRVRPAPRKPRSNRTHSRPQRGTLQVPNSTAFRTAINRCIECHRTKSYLGEDTKNVREFLPMIKNMNRDQFNKMIGKSKLTPEQEKAVRDFHKSSDSLALYTPTSKSKIASCYVSARERDYRISRMPNIQIESSPMARRLSEALDAKNVLYYNRKGMPRTWQSSPLIDVHTKRFVARSKLYSPGYQPNSDMYQKMGYFSNGALEFPWLHPGGTDFSSNTYHEKFVVPSDGYVAKNRYVSRRTDPNHFGSAIRNNNGPIRGWNFYADAMFVEVLKVRDPETKELFPVEIRQRLKLPSGKWKMDVLRPFESPADLSSTIRDLCEGNNPPAGCQEMTETFLKNLANPSVRVMSRSQYINKRNFRTKRNPLSINSAALTATQASATVHQIPKIPYDVLRVILKTTPFKSVFGKPWMPTGPGSPPGWAPSTQEEFSIVPKNYFGAFIPTTQKGCMNCHDSAGRHVEQFDPKREWNQMFASAPRDARRARTWYNHIPGSDGILSFHPFSSDAVKRVGNPLHNNTLNRCLIQNGLFVL